MEWQAPGVYLCYIVSVSAIFLVILLDRKMIVFTVFLTHNTSTTLLNFEYLFLFILTTFAYL